MAQAPPRPRRKITAEFYKTETGNEPVREWMKGLSKAERQAIGKDIRATEYGWPLGVPTCDSLGDGLWEVRITLESRIARVIFCMIATQMILLHGFIKKTQTTPKPDLNTAKERKRNLESRLREIEKQKLKARTKK
jgi:phage-related protein